MLWPAPVFALLLQLWPFPGPGVKPAGGGGCTTPSGTTLTESWGDAATSCWTSGPSTCNNTWVQITHATSTVSIVSAPGGAPSNTVCTNALQMFTSSSIQYDLSKSITAHPAATTPITVTAYVMMTSNGLSNGQEEIILAPSAQDWGQPRGSVMLRGGASTQYIKGSGSTGSSLTTISLNTWYKVVLYLATGTDASYISIDDGTHLTFTQNALDANYIITGDNSGNTTTMTYLIGALAVD